MNITPTKNVTFATLVSAVIGLAGWIFSDLTGTALPPEVIGWFTTLTVGAIAYAQRSAKVTAGAMASALVGTIVWVLGHAGADDIPAHAVAYLNTICLFVFAWVTTEFVNADPGEDLTPGR